MQKAAKYSWDAIVVTCVSKSCCDAYVDELNRRKRANLIDAKTLILGASDPGARVGSGGATLNGIMVVCEHMSSLAGYTVRQTKIMLDKRVLVLHVAWGEFCISPCGKALLTTPRNKGTLIVPSALDTMLETMHRLFKGAPPGCFVANTNSTFMPEHTLSWEGIDNNRVQVFLDVLKPEEVTPRAGLIHLESGPVGKVKHLYFDATPEEIKAATLPSGMVPYNLGLLYLGSCVLSRVLQMCVSPPLDACTYLGIDAGAPPLPLSLFLDVFTAMTIETTKEQYIERTACYNYGRKGDTRLRAMREKIYDTLSGVPLFGTTVQGKTLPDDFRDANALLTKCFPNTSKVNSLIGPRAAVAAGGVVSHSILNCTCRLGKGCMVSDVQLDSSGMFDLGDNLSLVCWHLSQPSGGQVFSLIGTADNILDASDIVKGDKEPKKVEGPTGTFLNQPWQAFFDRTGILATELWVPGVDEQCLRNAKLFPVCYGGDGSATLRQVLWMQPSFSGDLPSCVAKWRRCWRLSLTDLVRMVDVQQQMKHRIDLAYKQGFSVLGKVLAAAKSGDTTDMDVQAFFKTCAVENRLELFDVLDQIAVNTKDLGSRARVFAWIADAMGCFSAGRGGLRSGPANNLKWAAALQLLVRNHIEGEDSLFAEAVTALSKQRAKWMRDPLLLVRAARHYERAVQMLIGQAVESARAFVSLPSLHDYDAEQSDKPPPPPDTQWMVAEAGARLDFAGGWSDTPPLAFEAGGKVVNVAVLVNGKRPIGAEGRRIPEPELRFVLHGSKGQHVVTVRTLDEIRNFNQPQSDGALLKAAVCCVGIIDHTSHVPLAEQLKKVRGPHRQRVPDCCGFEIHSWSELPQGSGMGTSSILAGVVINVLWRLAGVNPDNNALHHMVLVLEQMMTTGGGWQDQVGGLDPGLKLGSSRKGLPLQVESRVLPVPKSALDLLDRHLLLVYTGMTRLARDHLQNVLRSWYSTDPRILSNVEALITNAENVAKACVEGDIPTLGRLVDLYWDQKKIMAPGSEPDKATAIMDFLRPHVYGQAMLGAGGGGFMFAVTKEPDSQERLDKMLEANPALSGVRVWNCTIDTHGLAVKVSNVRTYKPSVS